MSRRGLALGAALAVAPAAYRGAVRLMLRRNVARLRGGDLRPTLRAMASDVHFVFPGESSWSADLRGREEVERWQQRFLAVGLRLEARQIVVDGPPWATRIALRFGDGLTAPDGRRVYENEGVIFATARWGRVTEYTVYEDTQEVSRLDEYLQGAVGTVPAQ